MRLRFAIFFIFGRALFESLCFLFLRLRIEPGNSSAVKEFIFNDTSNPDDDDKSEPTEPHNPNEKHKVTLDDFYLLKVIGKGSFGKVTPTHPALTLKTLPLTAIFKNNQVMLAKHKQNGKVFAVKVISKKAVKQRDEVKHIMAGQHGFFLDFRV